MLTEKNLNTLADAVDALRSGDAAPLLAIAPLTELAADGLDVSIDFSAEERLGAPVIVATSLPGMRILQDLSPRRRVVAELVVKGLSNKAIARELDLSPATVKDHVHAVLKACNCGSRTELMALCHGA